MAEGTGRPEPLFQRSARRSISGLAATAGLSLLLVPSGVALSGHPTLTLSRASGGVGTSVTVVGRSCRKPFAQRDTLAWHDHFYLMHDLEKRTPLGVWRPIHVHRLSPTLVRATFTVQRADHLGRGLLDLLCRDNANATAQFTVTR